MRLPYPVESRLAGMQSVGGVGVVTVGDESRRPPDLNRTAGSVAHNATSQDISGCYTMSLDVRKCYRMSGEDVITCRMTQDVAICYKKVQ